MRSSATWVWATALVIFARSSTGLKNRVRYARNTVSDPTVIAPESTLSAPCQRTTAMQAATMTPTDGDRNDLIRRA